MRMICKNNRLCNKKCRINRNGSKKCRKAWKNNNSNKRQKIFSRHLSKCSKGNNRSIVKPSEADVSDIASLSECLKRLVEINYFLLEIHRLAGDSPNAHQGELFPSRPNIREERAEGLAEKIATVDFGCFYGRWAGFHYAGDCRRIARPLIFGLASFADVYDGSYMSRIKVKIKQCPRRMPRVHHALISESFFHVT